MDSMSVHHARWKTEMKESRAKLRAAVGNALLTAACAAYYGLLDEKRRARLRDTWLAKCEMGDFDTDGVKGSNDAESGVGDGKAGEVQGTAEGKSQIEGNGRKRRKKDKSKQRILSVGLHSSHIQYIILYTILCERRGIDVKTMMMMNIR